MKEDISQADSMLCLESKSLGELESIRARLLLLESKLDKDSLRKFQSNLEKELDVKESLLSKLQESQVEHLAAKIKLEESIQQLKKELDLVEQSLSLAEKDSKTAQQEIDRLTSLKKQQQSVLEKIQQNSQRNQEVLARVNELITAKTTLESSHEALMRILAEQDSLMQTLNASSSTVRDSESFFDEPVSESGKIEGDGALFAVATSLTKMSNSSSKSSSSAFVTTLVEPKRTSRSTAAKKRAFSPPPSALPTKRTRNLRSAYKRNMEETPTKTAASSDQASAGSVILEKDMVHEFLQANASMICEMFQKQHSRQKKDKNVLECVRIESGLWRCSDADAAKFGLKHIIGNNCNKQSFSVILRNVRISQRILDDLVSIAAETDKKISQSIPASFEDPRDASEIAEQLRLMYDALHK